MGTGLKFLFEEEVIMNQGTNLGSQKGRWIILAALVAVLGVLLFLLPGGLWSRRRIALPSSTPRTAQMPVVTLTAGDPEGATPITWSLFSEADGSRIRFKTCPVGCRRWRG